MAAERHCSSRRKSLHPHRRTSQWCSTWSHSRWNLRGRKFARYTHKERFQQAHNGHGRTKTRRCTGSWDVQGRRSSNMIQRGLGIATRIPPGPEAASGGVAGGRRRTGEWAAGGRRRTGSGCAAEGGGGAAGAAGVADAEAERGWAGCGCAGTPYQSYTSEMSRCSMCIERYCNSVCALLKDNRDW